MDFNDSIFEAIKKSTGDDLETVDSPETDNEMLKAIMHLLTLVLKKMVNEKPHIEEVVPFVS